MKESSIEKAYRHVAENNPEIIDQRHLELLTRKYIMRRKKIESAIFFFGGMLGAIVASCIEGMFETDSSVLELLWALLNIVWPSCVIVGVCRFAKALHDPLTPSEERELAIYDEIEKGGATNVDLSEFDNSAYLQYEQNKYDEASGLKKIWILAKRFPPLLWLFIIVPMITGIVLTIDGTHNILTYEERNANAIEIRAVAVDMDVSYDSDAERNEYTYTFEYTFNGETYQTTLESSSMDYDLGDTNVFLIDSKKPEKIIVNDGESQLTAGVIVLAITIFVLVYSFLNVRKPDSGFSIFSLFWMMFAAGAIGFAVWGISMLILGQWAGLLPLLVGSPMMLMGVFLFRMIFNPKK